MNKNKLICVWLLVFGLIGNVFSNTLTTDKSIKKTVARVTYYWGDKNTATNTSPKSKKTVAVDPRVIPYGSEIYIPEIKTKFLAMDTGSAVKKRTASRFYNRNNIVIDVYCKTYAEAKRYINQYPMFMEVEIYKINES